MKIISADERVKSQGGIKGVITGPYKVGKTSLLYTLPPESTLFIDLEAGGLSVMDWGGDSVEIKDWTAARDIACLLGGPNPSRRNDQAYSQAHFEYASKAFGDPESLAKYETVFIDSITVASRLAFQWAKGQPEAIAKNGNQDTRAAYGVLAQEMVAWITQLQHAGSRNVWFVGLLDLKRDECKRPFYELQIEGVKTGLELPGILDEVITMAEMQPEKEGDKPYRAFVCQRPNPWGYPAGDRSGKLDMVEPAHLGRLMDKIRTGQRKPVDDYQYNIGE